MPFNYYYIAKIVQHSVDDGDNKGEIVKSILNKFGLFEAYDTYRKFLGSMIANLGVFELPVLWLVLQLYFTNFKDEFLRNFNKDQEK